MKVFITRKIPEIGLQKLKEAGIEVIEWDEKKPLSQPELIKYSKQCDALLSAGFNKIDAHFLKECKHLKVIALHSVGFDNVDIAAANALKIPVGNTPGILNGRYSRRGVFAHACRFAQSFLPTQQNHERGMAFL